jgi:glutamyl-tRNA reductase
MSGPTVSRALQNRFEAIRQNEVVRLEKKMRGLTDDERQSVEAITVDIIRALARGADRALAADVPEPALDALVRLFALEGEVAESR